MRTAWLRISVGKEDRGRTKSLKGRSVGLGAILDQRLEFVQALVEDEACHYEHQRDEERGRDSQRPSQPVDLAP